MYLSDLNINNLTVIQSLSLQFGPGLIALTGETGAGKSIMLNALDMVLGARAKTDMIRQGAKQAQITAQFALSQDEMARLNEALDQHGLPACESGQLLIRRQLNENGRHRQWINDGLTTAAVIRDLVDPFVDMTGQHAQQRLLKPAFQRDTLDAFGHLDAQADKVAQLFEQVMLTQQEIINCGMDEQEKLRRQDWLQYQIDEIANINPEVGEDEKLAEQRKRLANVAQIQVQSNEVLELLTDGSANALTLIQRAAPLMDKLVQADPALDNLRQQINDAAVLLEETSRDLHHFGTGQDADPETLSQLDNRLDALYRLQRKHGKNIEDILSLHAEMEQELSQLRDLDAHLAACEKKLQKQFKTLHDEAQILSASRAAQSKRFAELICTELADLGMPHGRFEVCFEPLSENATKVVTRNGITLGRYGAENVSFSFAANPGQKMGALQAVASGGELSRTLLALKRVLQMADPVPITVFDEVDAGVGGGIGEIIGKKLAALGEFRQVFCVTHLGQIASQAHQHYRVSKEVVGKETQTTVQALKGNDRIEEVARMIGGEALTEVTLAHANEMVQSAATRVSVH